MDNPFLVFENREDILTWKVKGIPLIIAIIEREEALLGPRIKAARAHVKRIHTLFVPVRPTRCSFLPNCH
ncbi:MAG: hypothetical protein QF619_07270, partial [Candidatus Binatia bacterium]|nr:hypothetical protein [Candidatus Binatia bacterium]